ncbi:MAG: hypothetical protein ABFD49_01955 [Armatimonadota bacterium]|nr:hypothetical protein [bacterium]
MSKAVLALIITIFVIMSACLWADETTNKANTSESISLDLKNIDVKSAIEAMFRNAGKNFSMDQNVEGIIPLVSFTDVPFDTALKSLTKSAGLVFRIDHDIYLISKKPEVDKAASVYTSSPPPPPEVEAPKSSSDVVIDKVPLNYSSPSEILAIMSGSTQYGALGNGYGGYGGFGGGYGGYGGMMGMMGGMGGINSGGLVNNSYSSNTGYRGSGSSYGSYSGYNRGW